MKKLKIVLGVLAIAGVFTLVNSNSSNVEDINNNKNIAIRKEKAKILHCTSGHRPNGHNSSCYRDLPTNG